MDNSTYYMGHGVSVLDIQSCLKEVSMIQNLTIGGEDVNLFIIIVS